MIKELEGFKEVSDKIVSNPLDDNLEKASVKLCSFSYLALWRVSKRAFNFL